MLAVSSLYGHPSLGTVNDLVRFFLPGFVLIFSQGPGSEQVRSCFAMNGVWG